MSNIKNKIEINQNQLRIASFTIKATIPTGAYSNISPEIVENDTNINDIHSLILPEIDKLFDKYLNYNEKLLHIQKDNNLKPVSEVKIKNEKYDKALEIIESSNTKESLDVILLNITNSKNFSEEEKKSLIAIVNEKQEKYV